MVASTWVTSAFGPYTTRAWRRGDLIGENFALADVSDQLEDADTLVWVDFCNPSRETCSTSSQAELGLHELAVEDALGPHQRPKLDKYEHALVPVVPCGERRPGRRPILGGPRSTRSSTPGI